MTEPTKSLTGFEGYDELLRFTRRAKDLGVVSFELTRGDLSYKAHLLPEPPDMAAQKKQDEADLYGAA